MKKNSARLERDIKLKMAALKKPTTRQIEKIAPKKIISRQNLQRKKPEKIFKLNTIVNSKILLDPPTTGTTASIEYPTPSWFRSTEEVEVSIIIPLYKSNEVIIDLIENWHFDKNINAEIIFVDDCCPNNSKEIVLNTWTKCQTRLNGRKVGKIISNIENKGYGLSCNVGTKYATGQYLIFLNADTKVTYGWIKPMLELFDDPQVGIVGNLHLKQGGTWDGTIDSAGSEWIWNDASFLHIGRHSYKKAHLSVPYKPEQAPEDIMSVNEREMVTGCCFTIKASLFNYVGGFNANYRIGYWEDAELCLNVRELGYKVMFTPNSTIWHKLSHTNSGGHKFNNHNKNYFINKWITSGRIDNLVKQKRSTPNEIGTILINRRGANGDVLAATSIINPLKKKYPKSNIIFATDCPEVLKGNKLIDKIIKSNEISERMFQLYYNLDMVYEYRPNTPILNAYAEEVGVSVEDCKPFISVEPYPENLPLDYVVIHAGKTAWVGRDWKPERFIQLAQNLLDKGINVISVGRNGDYDIPCTVNLINKTNIQQMAWIISKANSFIGIDSFPMHIAQTFDIPGVCFFGCINPETRIYSPVMKPVTASNLSCLGCHHIKPTPCTFTNNCIQGNQDCINLVTIDNMLATLNK